MAWREDGRVTLLRDRCADTPKAYHQNPSLNCAVHKQICRLQRFLDWRWAAIQWIGDESFAAHPSLRACGERREQIQPSRPIALNKMIKLDLRDYDLRAVSDSEANTKYDSGRI